MNINRRKCQFDQYVFFVFYHFSLLCSSLAGCIKADCAACSWHWPQLRAVCLWSHLTLSICLMKHKCPEIIWKQGSANSVLCSSEMGWIYSGMLSKQYQIACTSFTTDVQVIGSSMTLSSWKKRGLKQLIAHVHSHTFVLVFYSLTSSHRQTMALQEEGLVTVRLTSCFLLGG